MLHKVISILTASSFHFPQFILGRDHQFFPVDYILMVMIILYMFWATTKGIISIGIRFLWVNLYKFRQAATPPQGLLAATLILMLSLAGMCYSLTMSVAPDYAMFGSQKYVSCLGTALHILQTFTSWLRSLLSMSFNNK